jgi:ABC-2 type transport system permease protein
LGRVTTLVVKEVKELIRDPKILIGVILMPVIIFPVMGSAINVSQKSVMQAMITASFAIYSEDEGEAATALLNYIYINNTIVPIDRGSLEEAIVAFQDTDATTLLFIPDGYSENVSRGLRGRLKIYANLKSMTIAETGTTDALGNVMGVYGYLLSLSKINSLLEGAGVVADPQAVRTPLYISYSTIIKGNVLEVAPSSIFSLIMTQSIMLPIMVMVMLMFAIQMAATSIAIEK